MRSYRIGTSSAARFGESASSSATASRPEGSSSAWLERGTSARAARPRAARSAGVKCSTFLWRGTPLFSAPRVRFSSALTLIPSSSAVDTARPGRRRECRDGDDKARLRGERHPGEMRAPGRPELEAPATADRVLTHAGCTLDLEMKGPRVRPGDRLLELDEVERRLKPFGRRYLGVREIPLDALVGTE